MNDNEKRNPCKVYIVISLIMFFTADTRPVLRSLTKRQRERKIQRERERERNEVGDARGDR